MMMVKKILVFYALLSLVIIAGGCSDLSLANDEDCIDTNCADYTSQSAAQAAYNADPICRGDLDADNDGTVCEEPGNSVTNCANTSNCGCSNLNKSPCQNNPCCKWVVGSGCECK